MRCPGFPLEDYGSYALGLLSGDEHDQIERHLRAGCETCVNEVRQSRETWSYVGLAAPPAAAPSAALKRRIANMVGPVESAVWQRQWWLRPVPWFAAASCAALMVSGTLAWKAAQLPQPLLVFSPVYPAAPAPQIVAAAPVIIPGETRTLRVPVADPAQARQIATLDQDLALERQKAAQLEAGLAAAQKQVEDAERKYTAALDQNQSGSEVLRRQVTTLNARLSDLDRQASQYKALLETQRKRIEQDLQLASLVSSPGLRIYKLRGTEKGKELEGHALIASGGQVLFYASQLPALPAGRTYQLWMLREKGPAVASAGIFNPGQNGAAALQLSASAPGITAFAVTDEPSGGSLQPTGHKWLVGT